MENRWREIMRGQRPAEEDDIRQWADSHRTRERRQIEEAAAAKIEGASSLVRRAIRLLADADRAWTTVSGIVPSSGDEEVLDVGRGLFHRERGTQYEDDEEVGTAEDDEDEPRQWEVEARFCAAQPPLRLRLECLREVGFPEEESRPELVILAGRQYWVVSNGNAETLPADPERILQIGNAGEVWSSYEDGVERGPGGMYPL